jgi:transcriptional regulator with XRE-family HTH domain
MATKSDQKSSLANRLREARELAGLSQSQVAKMLDLHRPAISEIEAGRRDVSASELARFAEIYGVSTEWLLGKALEGAREDQQLLMAARELSKIGEDDFNRLMKVIRILRKSNSTT